MYEPRTYRHWVQGTDLVSFNVVIKETDLYIRASADVRDRAFRLAVKYRGQVEKYIREHPDFAASLEPVETCEDSPQIIKDMAAASALFNVGPMAAVAGAIAQYVGSDLPAYSPEIIIENGGDIFINSLNDRTAGIYAGRSPLSGKLGLKIRGEETPAGICTSSGTVGHSLSFGKADAAVAVAASAVVADAAATSIGNMVSTAGDIDKGLDYARNSKILKGAVIIKDDRIGIWGDIRICEIPVI